ncbi:RidA family protein [Falsiroseomonas sp.]|uniref:RidA family protein n=1 Tax=Falsiroseomonas sp. TaxID=2870721 RepID=UPI00356A3BB4
MSFEERLKDLGITLPPPRPPAFGYVPVVVEGGLAWVSGQLPWDGDGLMARGRLGEAVDVETGRAVARCCLLNGLAVLREALGTLDRVKRVVKVVGFVSSAPGFFDQPAVVDGASRALAEIFGDAGRHARSAVGVAALPRDVPVEIEFVTSVQ